MKISCWIMTWKSFEWVCMEELTLAGVRRSKKKLKMLRFRKRKDSYCWYAGYCFLLSHSPRTLKFSFWRKEKLTPFQGSTGNMTEMGLGTKILGWPGGEFPFCRRSAPYVRRLMQAPPYTLIQNSFKSLSGEKFSTLLGECALSVIYHIFLDFVESRKLEFNKSSWK